MHDANSSRLACQWLSLVACAVRMCCWRLLAGWLVEWLNGWLAGVLAGLAGLTDLAGEAMVMMLMCVNIETI